MASQMLHNVCAFAREWENRYAKSIYFHLPIYSASLLFSADSGDSSTL